VTWATALAIAASMSPRLHEALRIWNTGQHDAERDVEAGAVVAEPGGDRAAGRRWHGRARGVASQPEPVEAAGDLQAVGVGRDQPQRGAVCANGVGRLVHT
jgi:hypothetical protein